MDKTLRTKITNITTFVLAAICLIGYVFGWVDPSSLICPAHSSLTLHSKNIELLRNGTPQTHTVSNLDCVNAHGVSVPNNADMIFGLVCVLPFLMAMVWGFVANLLRNKKKQGLSAPKGERKPDRTLASDNHKLEKYFRFTPDDLNQNRNGLVSESQKRELQSKRLDKAFRTLMLLAWIVLIGVAILRLSGGMMLLSVLALYFAPVLAVIIGILFFPVFKKTDFSLKSAQGKVDFVKVFKKVRLDTRTEQNGHGPMYDPNRHKTIMLTEMRIGLEVFGAEDALLEIVHPGDMCRVYSIGSGDIVSMEFLL